VFQAFAERVFSVLKKKWNGGRNKCLPNLIKFEIQINESYSHSSRAFFHDIKNDIKHLHAKRETKYGLSLESSGM
jgi:hypothetical protein